MEESGTVIVKVSEELTKQFAGAVNDELINALIQESGLDAESVNRQDAAIDTVSVKREYVVISHDATVWHGLSDSIVGKGTNIEYYARHHDEYGTSTFYALTPDGTRSGFRCEEECDEIEEDYYITQVHDGLDKWNTLLPRPIKDAFPGFASIEELKERF